MKELRKALEQQKAMTPNVEMPVSERVLGILVRTRKFHGGRELTHGEMCSRCSKFLSYKELESILEALISQGMIGWRTTGRTVFYRATDKAIQE